MWLWKFMRTWGLFDLQQRLSNFLIFFLFIFLLTLHEQLSFWDSVILNSFYMKLLILF